MKLLYSTLLAILLSTSMHSQENLSYQKPSKEILDLVEYERAPSVSMDTKKEWMLLSYRSTYKNLDDLNQEELRLGGLRINPNTNISSSVTYINNLKVRKVSAQNEIQVKGLPANAKITNISFSPDETKVAFTNTTDKGVELWILDIAKAEAKKITTDKLNANMGSPYNWYRDSKSLLIKKIPSNRPELINSSKAIPTGPTVSNSDGKASSNRTYQDLLKNSIDEQNFETIVRSELYRIDLNGKETLFKGAALYAGESFSPDGNYLMLTTLERPFSYIVPLNRFPMLTQVYDLKGKLVKEVNNVPLSEVMPKGFMSTRTGKRNMSWRADAPATLVYVEALDGGDPAVQVPFRDEVYTWDAPFNAAPKSLLKTPQRYAGIQWATEKLALVSDSWYDTRNTKTYIFDPSASNANLKVLSDRNSQDIYSDPGSFEMKKNQYGRYVIDVQDNKAYLIGDGFTPKGQFPFIDMLDFGTLKTSRLYTSNEVGKKEDIISIQDIKKGEVLVMLQSKNEYPNYFYRNIKNKKGLVALTNFKNPFESIKDVYKEVIKYKRNDGVELSGTLYLPANYDRKKKTQKLPLLIWAYPTEFKDKNSAGQSSQNPNEFTFPYYGSFVYWAAKGYAVLDDASFPIIGEGTTEPNDSFIKQLVANGDAAIDAVDKLGYINPKKVAVGGHSYGAFMTANLLTHSDRYACGIARSGAYNRTLTPFGFQSEQRNYWEAKNIYTDMSPFMNAEKMKTPMLLVHGEADNNPGTFTLQTERYFQALKGLGAPVRMVLLPKESHSYVAKENILHLLWEQDQFLEKHLK